MYIILISFFFIGLYFTWCACLDFSHWKELRKIKQVCHWCGEDIDNKQKAVYEKPADESFKCWFHKTCYDSYLDDCKLEEKRNRH